MPKLSLITKTPTVTNKVSADKLHWGSVWVTNAPMATNCLLQLETTTNLAKGKWYPIAWFPCRGQRPFAYTFSNNVDTNVPHFYRTKTITNSVAGLIEPVTLKVTSK